MIERLKKVGKTVRDEWRNSKLYQSNTEGNDLKTNLAVKDLKTKGYHIIPNFFNKENCDLAKSEIQDLLVEYKEKVWVDDEASDHRLFGADRVSKLFQEIYDNEFIRNVGEAYLGKRIKDGFLLAAKLEFKKMNKGSGGGWHRDTAGRPQFKAITYLTDVKSDSGPFQYAEGTQQSFDIVSKVFKFNLKYRQQRFTDTEVDKVLTQKDKIITMLAEKGTTILVDTRGIHRGCPIERGERIALTHYFWTYEIPKHMRSLVVSK